MNNSWQHFKTIEKLKAKINYGEILYKHFENPFRNQNVKIATMMEHNLLTNFAALKARNVYLYTFDKKRTTDTHNQSCDDIQMDPRESYPFIEDKRTHALDQKATPLASSIPDPSSKILSSMTEKEYSYLIVNFSQLLLNNFTLTSEQLFEIEKALDALKASSGNLQVHQIIWLETLHLFPDNYIPPIRIPNNFCIDDLLAEALNSYHLSVKRFNNISAYLKKHNVPENDYVKAGEIFDESFIQKMYEECEY